MIIPYVGPEDLLITSGKNTDFVVVQLAAGEKKNIEIKENSRGFEFGLSVDTAQNQQGYMATMFDAQELDKGKLIKVSRESGQYKARILVTDGTEHPLTNKRTKHYRQEDRINLKFKIDQTMKAVKSTVAVAEIATTAATGVQ